MKVKNIISTVREMCIGCNPNDDCLLRWLFELDKRLYKEKFSEYEDCPPYTPVENGESSLLISEEYADIYRYYLLMKIYLNIGDYERYNNFAQAYATELDSFLRNFASKHKHKSTNFNY